MCSLSERCLETDTLGPLAAPKAESLMVSMAGRRRSPRPRPLRSPGARARRPAVLVIEDDAPAREALGFLLEYYGYDVIVAATGAEGLALVTETTPDLVLTDWRMPGLSGLDLCLALRERRETMPIVVLTSAEEVFERDQPVNARLRKPIDPPLLHRVIRNELRARTASGS